MTVSKKGKVIANQLGDRTNFAVMSQEIKKGKGKFKWSIKLLNFNPTDALGIGYGVSSKLTIKTKDFTFNPNSGNGLHWFHATDGFSFYKDVDLTTSKAYESTDINRGQIGDVIDFCVDRGKKKLTITNTRSNEVKEFDITLPVYPSIFLNYSGDSIEIVKK